MNLLRNIIYNNLLSNPQIGNTKKEEASLLFLFPQIPQFVADERIYICADQRDQREIFSFIIFL
jgi:hypothetical protein